MAFEKIDKRTFFTAKPTNFSLQVGQILSETELDQLLLKSVENSLQK